MRSQRVQLVLASALMLFTELVLIRWIGANVVYLSYFSNFVLLGSFLGIGIGFLRARKGPSLFPWAPVLLTSFAAFVTAFPVQIDRSGSDLVFFGALRSEGLPAWLMLPVIFIAVAAILASIAHGVAVRFARFDALEAYRLDILGSLGGIVLFAGLAWIGTPPLLWGAVIASGFLLLLGDERRPLQVLASLALVFLLGLGSLSENTIWSPYYRITYERAEGGDGIGTVYGVDVNGIPHQNVLRARSREEFEPYYFTPYERIRSSPPGHVLIVGAGTGSDVAIALAEGAAHVDAVEIDPELSALGARLNPDRPYDDPRVDVYITDGRAYLENTDQRYDLILFALPDSLTLVSGQSGVRLESYLFTSEAFEAARDRLAPGGAFALYNYYREGWLVDRLAGTLGGAFGQAPCIDSYRVASIRGTAAFSVMVAAREERALSCERTWRRPSSDVVPPATDDHPFVYLRERSVPARYGVTLLLILAVSIIAVRTAGGQFRAMRGVLDLFFMGAAFLLLETMNVVRFALLFGTTWFVNALVFAAILATVLLAVEVERRIRIGRPGILYSLLFLAIAVSFAIPTEALLELPPGIRFTVASALAFAPIFIANLVFAGRFRDVADPTAAFGANLLGAMVGGVLEYLSLVTGHRVLLLVTAGLYCFAWFFGRSAVRRSTSPRKPVTVETVGA